MDGQRFDEIAKALATAGSRRALIRGLVFGAAANLVRHREAEAERPCSAGQPCANDTDCCGRDQCRNGHCVVALPPQAECASSQACTADSDCCLGEACVSGRCGCVGTRCNGACVDLVRDNLNCGGCGIACSMGQTCCGGVCIDVLADPANCGGCGFVCGIGQGCCAGACVDLATDPGNCGTCGVICGAGEACQGGSCLAGCPAGTTACGTACVDLMSSPFHCGGCKNICDSGQCDGGACVPQPDFRECTPSEVQPCEVFEPFDAASPDLGGLCRPCRIHDCEVCVADACVRLECGPCETCDIERPGECRPCNPDWCEGCSPGGGSGCVHPGCPGPCENCRYGAGMPGSDCVYLCAPDEVCGSNGNSACDACMAGTEPCNGPGIPLKSCGTCTPA